MSGGTSADEVVGYFESLSNWGRWGADDRLGTLNLAGPAERVAAAGLVRDGDVVSLSRDMDPQDPDPLGRHSVLQRFMELGEAEHVFGPGLRFEAVREYVAMVAHGSHTHLDGLAHFSWDGRNYNGFPVEDTRSIEGATSLSVHHASDGVVTRGVLLDVPAVHGVPWLEPGYAITPDDLEAAEARQGTRLRPGDALLVRTGSMGRVAAEGLHPDLHQPGLSAACLPLLRDRDVCLLGMDGIQDVSPPEHPDPDLVMPVHCVGLVAMGLWLIDNAHLDELAEVCATKGRWEFSFSLLPWRLVGVTSSFVNPVAVF